MLQFKDIKQNSNVYILDKNTVEITTGKISSASFPKLEYIPESQISDLIETHKINLNKKATLGDMIYATNVAYSTFYPDLLKDMKACLIHAHKMVNSVNGYDGAIFCRWTADAIGKAIKIDWEKFI